MNNSIQNENRTLLEKSKSSRPPQCHKKYLYPDHGGQVHLMQNDLLDIGQSIDFSASINPLGPSRNIQGIMEESISTISKYPDSQSSELKQALSRYLRTEENRIVITNGATELIYLLPHLMRRGQELLVLIPFFSEYQRAFKLSKIPVRTLPYDIGKGFEPPINELINLLNENSKIGAVVVGHPNSPTGRLWDRETLSLLATACENQGKLLIIDETFVEFCSPGSSVVEWSGNFPHLILIRSMTKFFALPGLRLGYGVMDSKWVQKIEKFRPPWSVNSMAQAFGLISLKDKPFIENSRSFVRKQRTFLLKHLVAMPWLKVFPSDANFILFRLRERQEAMAKRFYCQLLQDGFILRNCGNFEGLDNSYFRICVRNRDENKLLLAKIKFYFSSWVTN